MKYFSRKRKPKRFYVLVGLFTAMTLTVWANLAHTDSKAELTLEAGLPSVHGFMESCRKNSVGLYTSIPEEQLIKQHFQQ